jgi:hypothetical protein
MTSFCKFVGKMRRKINVGTYSSKEWHWEVYVNIVNFFYIVHRRSHLLSATSTLYIPCHFDFNIDIGERNPIFG